MSSRYFLYGYYDLKIPTEEAHNYQKSVLLKKTFRQAQGRKGVFLGCACRNIFNKVKDLSVQEAPGLRVGKRF